MKRRKFLLNSTIASVGSSFAFRGMPITGINESSFSNLVNGTDQILVLVQMNGGNDGLNTLIPLDQMENLIAHRGKIVIPETEVLSISDSNGLHPSLGGVKEMYDNGDVCFVQSVAYPNQNRSHFRSTDIWHSASDANIVQTEGWLGRYFDKFHPGAPDLFPNDDCPDPFSISVGDIAHPTCQGSSVNYCMSVHNVDNFIYLNEDFDNEVENECYNEELSFLRTSNVQSNAYFQRLEAAANLGNNLSAKYKDTGLSRYLKIIAQLISGGLGTKVYVVNYGVFDTHVNQVVESDTTTGHHANELKVVSDAIAAFHDDLNLLGCGDKVIGMAYSEFGRQIASQDGIGTDHGTAGPVMLFGNCIDGGIIGENPEILDELEPQAGVPMLHDFRSVYATIFRRWFDVSNSDTNELLYGDFAVLPFIKNCGQPLSIDKEEFIDFGLFPNPASGLLNISFQSFSYSGPVTISVYNSIGSELIKVKKSILFNRSKVLSVDISNLLPGQYILLINNGNAVKSKSFVKI